MKRILIAGIGNIFLGDDAFGVEVANELLRHPLPPEVRVKDYGIRGYDLAYALADGYDAAILVDAAPCGEAPGTVTLMEPARMNSAEFDSCALNAHNLDPVRVLQMSQMLGGGPARLYLVGCEPGDLDSEEIGRASCRERV